MWEVLYRIFFTPEMQYQRGFRTRLLRAHESHIKSHLLVTQHNASSQHNTFMRYVTEVLTYP